MTVGQQIKTLRKEKGLTQKRLAELSGLSEITIRQYEADKYQPKIEAVKKLAAALEVTPFDLIGYDYWNQTIDIERISKEASALDVISEMYGVDVQELLNSYAPLNAAGRQKAIEYVSDLAILPKYRK